jgi:hypothetical protein
MITLTTLKTRILEVLQDSSGRRFNDSTLTEALRQAIDLVNQKLPNIVSTSFTVTAAGRDQAISGLDECLYIISLCVNPDDSSGRELEPESGFSYRYKEGVPVLHFPGRLIPQAGDVLRITSAARHTLAGLDSATETTLPSACVTALVNGAAGQACLLRAGLLCETYGARPAEATRLLDLSHLLMDRCEQNLAQIKTLQEFGFPPGFTLDSDDRQTGRC